MTRAERAERDKRLAELRADGVSVAEIARRVGLTRSYVSILLSSTRLRRVMEALLLRRDAPIPRYSKDPELQRQRNERLAAGSLAGMTAAQQARREKISKFQVRNLLQTPLLKSMVEELRRRAQAGEAPVVPRRYTRDPRDKDARNRRLAAGVVAGVPFKELTRQERLANRSYIHKLVSCPEVQRIIAELRQEQSEKQERTEQLRPLPIRKPTVIRRKALELIDRCLPGLAPEERLRCADAWRAGVQITRMRARAIRESRIADEQARQWSAEVDTYLAAKRRKGFWG